MISKERLQQLRLANVRGRIYRDIRLCDDVIFGFHELFKFLGYLRWNKNHPDKTYEDFVVWKKEIRDYARCRKDTLEKRLERIRRLDSTKIRGLGKLAI